MTMITPQLSHTVWVAQVDTRYEVMAVGRTKREAIDQACLKALEFLRQNNATVEGKTDTVEGVEDYFGVWAQPVRLGTAVLVGIE